MNSVEWALIQYDWCPNKKRKLGHMHIEGRPCEDIGRRQASISQGKRNKTNPVDILISDF